MRARAAHEICGGYLDLRLSSRLARNNEYVRRDEVWWFVSLRLWGSGGNQGKPWMAETRIPPDRVCLVPGIVLPAGMARERA